MIWPRGAVAVLLLGALLMPCVASGDEGAPARNVPHAAAESTSVSANESSGYVFPSTRTQFRTWAMNCAGPAAIAGNLAGASWRQWVTDEPAQWDDDGRGFMNRLGTAFASSAMCETSLSLLSVTMGQDATYYRSPRAGLLPRARHALTMTVLARDHKGERVFSPGKSISPFVGPLVVENALYPEGYSFAEALVSGACNLLINAGLNVAREFILKSPAWNGERSITAGDPARDRAADGGSRHRGPRASGEPW